MIKNLNTRKGITMIKLKISYENDSVTTVFGVRRLTADGVHFKLNNKHKPDIILIHSYYILSCLVL